MKKNILVFPCGSEIGLEIYRSVNDSRHFELFGASSVDDHGKYIYKNYIPNIPFITKPECITQLSKIVKEKSIDAIYPAMDLVIQVLKENEEKLGCKVIAPCKETANLCLSKRESYKKLKNLMLVPAVFNNYDNLDYPVFAKPNIGYGSRNIKKIESYEELIYYTKTNLDALICEYLPGEEFTVDCFTDKNRQLRFVGPRKRSRVMNGISVNTQAVLEKKVFEQLAIKINENLDLRGAWFFQVKKNRNDELVLLELACRLGGSSSLFRAKGINFALLTLYDAFDQSISILENEYCVEMDRALDNKFKLDLNYNEVFIDYDDCIYSKEKGYNTEVLKFLFECKNKHITLSLISKHEGNLEEELQQKGIYFMFDRIFHLQKDDKKFNYIDNKRSIFIDDSFAERKEVLDNLHISVFSIDMIQCLL